jgi:uncharacterized protein (DUF2252 family)
MKAWVTSTLDYAIRNSSLVNTQSREQLKKFIEAYDKARLVKKSQK